MRNIKAQVTIFIIIAIILVGLVVSFFVFKEYIPEGRIPSNMEPIHKTFLSCLENEALLVQHTCLSHPNIIF